MGQGFLSGLVVKTPPSMQGDAEDVSSIPGSGRSPEEEMATHSSILAWEIPWTEDLAGYSPWGHGRVRQELVTKQQSGANSSL